VPQSRIGYAIRLAWEVAVQVLHTVLPRVFLGRRSVAGAEPELLAARLYSRLAYAYWFQRGTVACAWAHLREMNLAERYETTPELAQAYSEHAPVMTMLPSIRRGISYAERSLAMRRALGDVWGQGQSLHFYGVVLYAGSRYAECIARCREAVKLLERTGDQWEVNTASWHIALSQYRLGELGAAVEASRRVYQVGREIGDRQACGIGLAVWAKASGGRLPHALIAAELARPSDDVHTSAEVLQAEALRLLADDHPAEAVATLMRADRMVAAAGLRQEYVAPILPWLATALRRQAEAAPAWAPRERAALIRRAWAAARRGRRLARLYRNNLPHALRECGLLAAMSDRPRQAWRLLTESLAEAERQQARYEHVQTRLARARVGRLLGWGGADAEEARALEDEVALRREADPALGRRRSRVARCAALLEAGRTIVSARTRSAILGAVREAALSLLAAERCAILDATLAPLCGPDVECDRTAAREALEARRCVEVKAGPGTPHAGSVLYAPIVVRDAPAGCLYVARGVFDHEERRVVEFIAALAGAALDQAETLAELERLLADGHRAEARLRALLDSTSEIMTVLTSDGTVRFQSPSLERVCGYRPGDVIGHRIFGHVHPEDRAAASEALAQAFRNPGTRCEVALRARHRDGSWRWLEAVGVVSSDASGEWLAIVNSRDVTERRALQERLRDAQRMESVGLAAAAVAHDLNNLLAVILGKSQELAVTRPGDLALRRQVDAISQAIKRAAALTRRLVRG
jgi:PAS domain S-box-containing protein